MRVNKKRRGDFSPLLRCSTKERQKTPLHRMSHPIAMPQILALARLGSATMPLLARQTQRAVRVFRGGGMLLHLTSRTSAIAVALGCPWLDRRPLLSIPHGLLTTCLWVSNFLGEFLFHDYFFLAVFLLSRNALAVGAPLLPTLRIFSPDPLAIRSRFSWIRSYSPFFFILKIYVFVVGTGCFWLGGESLLLADFPREKSCSIFLRRALPDGAFPLLVVIVRIGSSIIGSLGTCFLFVRVCHERVAVIVFHI